MHPMMGLAALHGLIAVRYRLTGKVRVARDITTGGLAIYDNDYSSGGPTLGHLSLANGNYEPVPLSEFTAWDGVTPEMLERLLNKP